MLLQNATTERAPSSTTGPSPFFHTVRPVERGGKTVYEVVSWFFSRGRSRRKVVAQLRTIPDVGTALAHEVRTLTRLEADRDSIDPDDPGQLGMRQLLILGRRIVKVSERLRLLDAVARGDFGPLR